MRVPFCKIFGLHVITILQFVLHDHLGLQIFTQLMLVDKESEKHKWIDALHELHRIIRRNKIPHRNVNYFIKVMYMNIY